MFQLILPFQLDLPFDGPEEARAAQNAARVRRTRVRRRKGRALTEIVPGAIAPAAEAE